MQKKDQGSRTSSAAGTGVATTRAGPQSQALKCSYFMASNLPSMEHVSFLKRHTD